MQRADKRKYHYIYRVIRDDGKYYIGMHSTDDLDDGYFGSGQRISRSIKKHGKERHQKEILQFLPSRALLKAREKELITEDLRADKQCMNIAPGGGGGFVNEAHHQKASSSGGKVSGLKNIANARKSFDDSSMRKSMDTRASHGYLLTTSGMKFSDETKSRMSVSARGNRNSQFGTCWVTKTIPIKIKKEQLPEYLAAGYKRGRIGDMAEWPIASDC